MATTPEGIPLADDNTEVNPIQAPLNAMAWALDAALSDRGRPAAYTGTDAERLALAAPNLRDGITFYATDTKLHWMRVNGAWSSSDTGWVTLTAQLLSGFTGTVRVRLKNGVTEITGSVDGSFGSGLSTTNFLSGIPAQFRPSGATRLGSAHAGGYSGIVVVRADGTAGIAQRTGNNWNTALFSAVWLEG